LFGWLVARSRLAELAGFPALTADDERTIPLGASGDDDEPPLAPISCWPKISAPYGQLFPKRYVLGDGYAVACTAADWQSLAEARIVLLDPVYEASTTVDRFVPDEPFPDDEA